MNIFKAREGLYKVGRASYGAKILSVISKLLTQSLTQGGGGGRGWLEVISGFPPPSRFGNNQATLRN